MKPDACGIWGAGGFAPLSPHEIAALAGLSGLQQAAARAVPVRKLRHAGGRRRSRHRHCRG